VKNFDKEIKVSTCQQIFVLGAPRSGTTFLSSLLKKTSFNAPVETHFITKYYNSLRNYGDLKDRRNFRKLVNDILSERPVQQWHLNLDIEQLYDELPANFSYGDLVNAIILKRKQIQGGNRWGDKTPHYLGDLDILIKIFPKARFIYIVRDGRDVALSLLEKPWGPNNILKCAEYWSRLNSQDSTVQKLKDRNQLYFVKYEDLLKNTKEIVLEIYKFLDENITENEIASLAESVQSGNYNKWKKKMTLNQIRVFEAIASKELAAFGYEITNKNSKIFFLETQYFNMHEMAHRAWFLFNANIIDGFKIRYLGKEPFNE
jgi:hypothetical protein